MQVARDEDDVVQQPSGLGDLGLEARLAQVEGQRIGDFLLMILDPIEIPRVLAMRPINHPSSRDRGGNIRPVELAELDEAELDIAGLVLREGLAQSRHAILNLLNGSVLNGRQVGDNHGDGNLMVFPRVKLFGGRREKEGSG